MIGSRSSSRRRRVDRRDPLRVLFVDHERRLSGAERNLLDLVAALVTEGVDCHLAVPGPGELADATERCGATVHFFPLDHELEAVSRWELSSRPHRALRHVASAATSSLSLCRLARAVAPHVVHTNSQKAHVLAIPAALAARVPLVWSMQDVLEEGAPRRGMVWLANRAAARLVAISEVTAAGLGDGAIRARTRVVYPGVHVAPADPGATAGLRRTLTGGGPGPLVGMVAQIAHWKAQDVFVEAAAKLATEVTDVHFAIVGRCLYPQNEAAFEDLVRARAAELGLDDRLHWCGHLDDIASFMGAIDVLVHPSRLPEPFGRVIVEALAQGVPVVSTSIGAGPEIIPPDAGRIVPPDDPAAVAAAVRQLLDESDGTVAAARRGASRFTPARCAEGTLGVYRELGLVL